MDIVETIDSNRLTTGSSVVTTLLIFLSSTCCIGPMMVLFSFVGLSGATLLAIENIFGPYRIIILAITGVSLIAGFFLAYKPQNTTCEPGKICAQPKSRIIQRIGLWTATVFLLILLYFTYIHPNLDVLFGIYI